MPRGAKPGEYRGGRQKGTPNKATAEVKLAITELAKTHAPAALRTLAKLAESAESEQARVAACREILDRAYGRPAQAVTLAGGDGPPIRTQIISDDSVLAALRDLGQRVRSIGIPPDLQPKSASPSAVQANG